MLKLKLQYFGHLSLEKTLMLGKTEGRKRMGQLRKRSLDNITDSVDMNLSKLQEIIKDRGAWHAAGHEIAKSWTQLSNWTTTWQLSFLKWKMSMIAIWTSPPNKISCFTPYFQKMSGQSPHGLFWSVFYHLHPFCHTFCCIFNFKGPYVFISSCLFCACVKI